MGTFTTTEIHDTPLRQKKRRGASNASTRRLYRATFLPESLANAAPPSETVFRTCGEAAVRMVAALQSEHPELQVTNTLHAVTVEQAVPNEAAAEQLFKSWRDPQSQTNFVRRNVEEIGVPSGLQAAFQSSGEPTAASLSWDKIPTPKSPANAKDVSAKTPTSKKRVNAPHQSPWKRGLADLQIVGYKVGYTPTSSLAAFCPEDTGEIEEDDDPEDALARLQDRCAAAVAIRLTAHLRVIKAELDKQNTVPEKKGRKKKIKPLWKIETLRPAVFVYASDQYLARLPPEICSIRAPLVSKAEEQILFQKGGLEVCTSGNKL